MSATRTGADPEPRPSDGPEYHAEHAAWRERQCRAGRHTQACFEVKA